MTLKTSIAIHEPMPVKEVYDYCRGLLATPAEVEPITDDGSPGRRYLANPGGIGLAAWLWVNYGADGPLLDLASDDDDAPSKNGWASIEVTFDTAYSYREPNGAGCSDLHAWLVTELGRWLDERGKTWQWENEFTGDWHERFDLGVAELLEPVLPGRDDSSTSPARPSSS